MRDMRSMREPSLSRVGDRAIRLSFDDSPSRDLTALICGIAASARDLPGVIDAVPGTRTVIIECTDAAEVEGSVRSILDSPVHFSGSRHEVAVSYDGPDLEWALERLGLTLKEFVGLHVEREYDVRMIGSPGFIYLSNVHPALALPRLDRPRRRVEAGAVGIAGLQTGIYGVERPGGWRLIGRVEEVPAVQPGDVIELLTR